MQFFPHYPFTKMALEAGHISETDVSDEGIERATMYEWAYRPKFPAFRRRDYLENCIYLIPWTFSPVRWLIIQLQKRHNPIYGLITTILAKLRYWQGFQGMFALVWVRRIFVAVKLITRGDVKNLRLKTQRVINNIRFEKMKTGRLLSR